METQVLVDKEKAVQKGRTQVSLGRKRTAQCEREFVEATESVKRQKMETDSIDNELKQKETELHCLKELLQGKEEHNQTLKALVESKKREIKELKEKLDKSKEKLKQNEQEVAQLRDKLIESSNELQQKQKQMNSLEAERDIVIAENRKSMVEQVGKLRKDFEVRCFFI